MAVTPKVLLLLALISNNIQAQIIKPQGSAHFFLRGGKGDLCLVTRWTGEERKLLWNSSALPHPNGVPPAYYLIRNLNISHSGQYQEQCWTKGNVTSEKNSTLLVCNRQNMTDEKLVVVTGQRVRLTCGEAKPTGTVQWFREEIESYSKLVLRRNESLSFIFTVNIPFRRYYYCLQRGDERCEILSRHYVFVAAEFILRSEGESLKLNCSSSGQGSHVWRMSNSVLYDESSTNYTLTIPSLTLNHSGYYFCERTFDPHEQYFLFVCPKSDRPATVFFSGGENVTLQCGDWKHAGWINWLTRSNRTKGTVSPAQNDNIYLSKRNLVITNVSLQDSGEFWCVVEDGGRCVFVSQTLVTFKEPDVDHQLVRSVLLSVMIMVMCVVVVVTVWRSRRRQQLPEPEEELEMSELSPSAEQESF